jgi:O-antigen ligase
MIFLISPKKFGQGVGVTRIFSISARIDDYKQAINLWEKSPLIGFGYNRIRYLKNQTQAIHSGASFNSSYLIILVTTGVIGLMGFMGLMKQMWVMEKNRRYLILFIFIISLFDNILLHPFILFLLFSSLFDR